MWGQQKQSKKEKQTTDKKIPLLYFASMVPQQRRGTGEHVWPTCINCSMALVWNLKSLWYIMSIIDLLWPTCINCSMALVWNLKSLWYIMSIIDLLKFFSICSVSCSVNSGVSCRKFHFNTCRKRVLISKHGWPIGEWLECSVSCSVNSGVNCKKFHFNTCKQSEYQNMKGPQWESG